MPYLSQFTVEEFEEAREAVRQLCLQGMIPSRIAKELGLNPALVRMIIKGYRPVNFRE